MKMTQYVNDIFLTTMFSSFDKANSKYLRLLFGTIAGYFVQLQALAFGCIRFAFSYGHMGYHVMRGTAIM